MCSARDAAHRWLCIHDSVLLPSSPHLLSCVGVFLSFLTNMMQQQPTLDVCRGHPPSPSHFHDVCLHVRIRCHFRLMVSLCSREEFILLPACWDALHQLHITHLPDMPVPRLMREAHACIHDIAHMGDKHHWRVREIMGWGVSMVCDEECKKQRSEDAYYAATARMDSPFRSEWMPLAEAAVRRRFPDLTSFLDLMMEQDEWIDLSCINHRGQSLGEVCREAITQAYERQLTHSHREAEEGLQYYHRWSLLIHQQLMDHTPLAHELVDEVTKYLNLEPCTQKGRQHKERKKEEEDKHGKG